MRSVKNRRKSRGRSKAAAPWRQRRRPHSRRAHGVRPQQAPRATIRFAARCAPCASASPSGRPMLMLTLVLSSPPRIGRAVLRRPCRAHLVRAANTLCTASSPMPVSAFRQVHLSGTSAHTSPTGPGSRWASSPAIPSSAPTCMTPASGLMHVALGGRCRSAPPLPRHHLGLHRGEAALCAVACRSGKIFVVERSGAVIAGADAVEVRASCPSWSAHGAPASRRRSGRCDRAPIGPSSARLRAMGRISERRWNLLSRRRCGGEAARNRLARSSSTCSKS